MSLAVGALSTSKTMGLEENKEVAEKNGILMAREGEKKEKQKREDGHDGEEGLDRQMSVASLYATEDYEEEEEEEEDGKGAEGIELEEEEDGKGAEGIELGPQVSLKDQLEKDKDDESLRRWKEQLLGTLDFSSVGENLEPEVKILSLSIQSPGRPDMVLPLPMVPNSKGVWFTLKEGSNYRLKFSFSVSKNIVSGLRYTNAVWKTGVKVDSIKEMLGTFSPQVEPYTYEAPEETTPSGIFARGTYSARTRFLDDDGKCYLEINYTFDIRKEWPSTTG